MQDFSKLSGLKYNYYLQEYIYYSNKGYTKKVTPANQKVLTVQVTLQKTAPVLKKNPEYLSQANFIKSFPPR